MSTKLQNNLKYLPPNSLKYPQICRNTPKFNEIAPNLSEMPGPRFNEKKHIFEKVPQFLEIPPNSLKYPQIQ